MARTVDVRILGKSFTFDLSEGITPEEFLQISEYVEKRFIKIKSRMSELDAFRLGLLVAVNIAQDLYALKKENQKLHDIYSRIDHLLSPDDDEQLPIRFSS